FLPSYTYPDDNGPVDRVECRRVYRSSALARAIFGSAANAHSARCDRRPHSYLRQLGGAAANERQASTCLFKHCARWLSTRGGSLVFRARRRLLSRGLFTDDLTEFRRPGSR